MKLRINKAYDLSSISVLPPPRRNGGAVSSQGAGASQLRSQSQQSYSQGMSQYSQLSQHDESLICDQRLGSNDSASKAAPPFPSTSSCIRDESQLQLSRVAPSTVPRWSSSSARDSKYQINEELDQRLRHVETVLSRTGMIVDSVQSDVMHISRAVKEVLLETDGIRQKIVAMDNSLQQILKGEENVKALFDESLKSISCELTKNSDSTKLNEMSSQISNIPDQIIANFSKLHNEIIRLFSRETEIIISNIRSFGSGHRTPVQAPISKTSDDSRPLVKDFMPVTKLLPTNPGPVLRPSDIKIEVEKVKRFQPKPTRICQASLSKMKEPSARKTSQAQQMNYVNLDSDEEQDSGSCVILKKEASKNSPLGNDKENCWMKEAMEDSLRIIREARKRKRRRIRNLSVHNA